MYKLTLEVGRMGYDADFCFVHKGTYVPEGTTLTLFGPSVLAVYTGFRSSCFVGHRCCLDATWEPGPGYSKVSWMRSIFCAGLPTLLMWADEFCGYVNKETSEVDFHIGGNWDIHFKIEKLAD